LKQTSQLKLKVVVISTHATQFNAMHKDICTYRNAKLAFIRARFIAPYSTPTTPHKKPKHAHIIIMHIFPRKKEIETQMLPACRLAMENELPLIKSHIC